MYIRRIAATSGEFDNLLIFFKIIKNLIIQNVLQEF